MCTIGDNFFFLGSRLADSLLVQHTLGSVSARTPSAVVKAEREEVMVLPHGAYATSKLETGAFHSYSGNARLTSYGRFLCPTCTRGEMFEFQMCQSLRFEDENNGCIDMFVLTSILLKRL